ncbi:MAG: hypothetical protein ABFD05_02545 [Anaerolineaceae bacterium]
MVFCGECGELYLRVRWNNHGCKSIVWRCISRLEPNSAEMNCTPGRSTSSCCRRSRSRPSIRF